MKIEWALNIDGGAQPVDLLRDGERLGSHPPGISVYTDSGLSPNTRYTYEAVAAQAGLTAAATAATLAYPPQGGHSRSVHWTGFDFYIVDERNPAGTEYRVMLRDGTGTDVSDWGADKMQGVRRFGLRTGGFQSYYYTIAARNLDGIETQPADRRVGEAGQGPEWATTRGYAESNADPWVAARIDDLQAIYGLTDAAVDWLTSGIRIERPRRTTGRTNVPGARVRRIPGGRPGGGRRPSEPFASHARGDARLLGIVERLAGAMRPDELLHVQARPGTVPPGFP